MKFTHLLPTLLVLGSTLAACSAPAPPTAAAEDAGPETVVADADRAYLDSIEDWRQQRDAKLREPDGWLSFTGSGQVAAGTYRVGSAADNHIVVPGGPAHWGVLSLAEGGKPAFEAAPGTGLVVDGKPFQGGPLLTQLDQGGPTAVYSGQQRFYVVRTGDVHGWRFRDPQSPALQAFDGVPHFPVDPSWRIQARWQAYPQPITLDLVTSNGTIEQARVPGKAEFEHDGRQFSLLPVQEKEGDDLFFIIADRTSGKETYGGARFLYAKPPTGDTLVLDFNKAQNPPCALNGHVVCPTAPPENRLALQVRAGEKTYPLVH